MSEIFEGYKKILENLKNNKEGLECLDIHFKNDTTLTESGRNFPGYVVDMLSKLVNIEYLDPEDSDYIQSIAHISKNLKKFRDKIDAIKNIDGGNDDVKKVFEQIKNFITTLQTELDTQPGESLSAAGSKVKVW